MGDSVDGRMIIPKTGALDNLPLHWLLSRSFKLAMHRAPDARLTSLTKALIAALVIGIPGYAGTGSMSVP